MRSALKFFRHVVPSRILPRSSTFFGFGFCSSARGRFFYVSFQDPERLHQAWHPCLAQTLLKKIIWLMTLVHMQLILWMKVTVVRQKGTSIHWILVSIVAVGWTSRNYPKVCVGMFCFECLVHSLGSFEIAYAETLRKQRIALSPLCMRWMLTVYCALHALFFGNCTHMQRVSAFFQWEFVNGEMLAKAKKSTARKWRPPGPQLRLLWRSSWAWRWRHSRDCDFHYRRTLHS